MLLAPSLMPVSSGAIERFEAKLGFVLPTDYRVFLLDYNGGKIRFEHTIHLLKLASETFLNYLYPLSAPSPFLGITESRELQELNRVCLPQAIFIGDDMGTGFFFLILDGVERGSVYFAFKDDLPIREADWYADGIKIPGCMEKISSSFREFGELILGARSGL
jgi:hypothetical protein